MKQSPTNELTQFILADLFRRGVFAWRQNVAGIPLPGGGFRSSGKTGLPDIPSIWPPTGTFVGIEIKTGKDSLRPEQVGFGASAGHVGGYYLVVHTKEDYLEKISTVAEIINKCYTVSVKH